MTNDRFVVLLNKWKEEQQKMERTLQVGRCGSDDRSMDHGRMDMLEDCIEELENEINDD